MPFYEVVAYARNQAQLTAPTFTELGHVYSVAGSRGGGESQESGGLAWSKELHGDGLISVATVPEQLNDDIGVRLRDMDNKPTELGIFRDGVLVQRGPLIAWQVEGETLVLHARGLAYYMRYMFVTSDLSYNQDQALIVRDLIDHHQDKDYGDFGLDTTGIVAVGYNKVREYKAGELINIYQEVRDLGQGQTGYDLVVDPVTRDVTIYSPSKGTNKPASVLDNRVITQPNLSDVVTAGKFGSSAFVAGVDANGKLQTAIRTNNTVRNNFGLTYVARGIPGMENAGELGDAANRMRDLVSIDLLTPNKKYFSATGISVDDFDIGDTITFDYDAGFGRITVDVRVENMFISVSTGNLELLTLDLTIRPQVGGCT